MSFFTKKWKIFYIALAVVLGGVLFLFVGRDKNYEFETETVARRDITQTITETGIVEADANIDVSFEIPGRLKEIFVDEGEFVEGGALLASLDDSSLYADLLSARANTARQDATLEELLSKTGEGDSAEFQNLLEQQNLAVENAYRDLLSTDLVAVPEREFGTGSAPTISGTYNSIEEGQYLIDVYASATQSGASFTASGLELGSGPANQTGAVPLGSRGLFIKFPSGVIEPGKRWIVSIPNTRSSTYTTRLNAYEAAKKTRDLTLSQSETTPYDISIQEAQIGEARAAESRAVIAYNSAKLTAPWSGVVSEVYVLPGETVSALSPILHLVSQNRYEIEVYIPEDDIAYLEVGDPAEITFDAYPGEIFTAEVSFIAPAAVDQDGVTVFKTILVFAGTDPRIKSGLSADIDIVADERFSVLSVPTRAIVSEEGGEYVRVSRDGALSKLPVTTGLQGSEGYIEILTGLNEGDEIITFIDTETLEALSET